MQELKQRISEKCGSSTTPDSFDLTYRKDIMHTKSPLKEKRLQNNDKIGMFRSSIEAGEMTTSAEPRATAVKAEAARLMQ